MSIVNSFAKGRRRLIAKRIPGGRARNAYYGRIGDQAGSEAKDGVTMRRSLKPVMSIR